MPVRSKNSSSVTARFDIGGSVSGCRLAVRRRRYGCVRAEAEGGTVAPACGRGPPSTRRSGATACAKCEPRRGLPELSAARKLWCTVLPGCRRCSEAELQERRRGFGRAVRSRRSDRMRSRDRPKRRLRQTRDPPGRIGLAHGASSPKRGCKDMMLLTRYFRRCAPGPALRTWLVLGLAAILLAGLPAAGWAWGAGALAARHAAAGDPGQGSDPSPAQRAAGHHLRDHASSFWRCCFM